MQKSENQNDKKPEPNTTSDEVLQKEDDPKLKSNKYCSVPILQKVLVPYPGYTSRLYSVQVMRSEEAKDFYQNVGGKCKQEEQNVSGSDERERSPTRVSRNQAINEYWNTLECKEFKQYKDAVLYRIEKPPSRTKAMRSNKEQDITTTTFVHNSSRGRPVSQVFKSGQCSKVTGCFSDEKHDSNSIDVLKVKFPDSEHPINLSINKLYDAEMSQ
eukprot:GFUD01022675.1.p1 GENE.GFUD01022675.1~~GFUD01022675.1.p1  ORF type:complete len:214 (-),score=60.88 GFUD01022675.1:93-734(-)